MTGAGFLMRAPSRTRGAAAAVPTGGKSARGGSSCSSSRKASHTNGHRRLASLSSRRASASSMPSAHRVALAASLKRNTGHLSNCSPPESSPHVSLAAGGTNSAPAGKGFAPALQPRAMKRWPPMLAPVLRVHVSFLLKNSGGSRVNARRLVSAWRSSLEGSVALGSRLPRVRQSGFGG